MFSDEVPALSSDLLPSQMLEVVSFKYIIPHGFEYTSFKYIYYCECKFFYTDLNVLTDVGKLNIFKQLFAAIARASHRSQPKVTDMRFILLGGNCKEKGDFVSVRGIWGVCVWGEHGMVQGWIGGDARGKWVR